MTVNTEALYLLKAFNRQGEDGSRYHTASFFRVSSATKGVGPDEMKRRWREEERSRRRRKEEAKKHTRYNLQGVLTSAILFLSAYN